MKMTVYLPDDLAHEAKQLPGLNVSGVLQAALRQEIARRTGADGLDAGMERQVVDAAETHGAEVAFVGKQIELVDHQVAVYLTKGRRIAIHDGEGRHLYVFDTFAELVQSGIADTNPRLLADIAERLGEKHVIELDI